VVPGVPPRQTATGQGEQQQRHRAAGAAVAAGAAWFRAGRSLRAGPTLALDAGAGGAGRGLPGPWLGRLGCRLRSSQRRRLSPRHLEVRPAVATCHGGARHWVRDLKDGTADGTREAQHDRGSRRPAAKRSRDAALIITVAFAGTRRPQGPSWREARAVYRNG
jgi:hypothetical protein